MLELNPEWATNLGDHRFDDQVSDLSDGRLPAPARTSTAPTWTPWTAIDPGS